VSLMGVLCAMNNVQIMWANVCLFFFPFTVQAPTDQKRTEKSGHVPVFVVVNVEPMKQVYS